MKVTSQDIRNLAEALPILQKNMYFHNRLTHEDSEEDEEVYEEEKRK